jgi:AraC-like DNA-binding protein
MLRGSIQGQVPYERFHQTGVDLEAARVSEEDLWSRAQEWQSLDANPLYLTAIGTTSRQAKLGLYNAYNCKASLGVRTFVDPRVADDKVDELIRIRRRRTDRHDPYPCRFASVNAVITTMQPRDARSLVQMADRAQAHHTTTFEVLRVLEADPTLKLQAVANELGVSLRTLQRRLSLEGMNFELVAQAAKLNHATLALQRSDSLTQIALAAGYSDLAHMTKAFVKACCLPPSSLRALATPDPVI